MLVAELIRDWREDEKDDKKPYFWSDRQLLRWLNEGMRRYASETRSIVDSSSRFTQFELEPDMDRLPLDDRVLEILQASTRATPRLELVKPGALPLQARPVSGHPRQLEVDIDARQIRLHPVPMQREVLQLLVVRLPLCPLDLGSEIPDVPDLDLQLLHHYLNFKAYAVQDAETINPQKSGLGEARFIAGCAEVMQRAQARRRANAGRVRYRD